MAQDQELGLAIKLAAATAIEDAESRAEREVDETQQHRFILPTPPARRAPDEDRGSAAPRCETSWNGASASRGY